VNLLTLTSKDVSASPASSFVTDIRYLQPAAFTIDVLFCLAPPVAEIVKVAYGSVSYDEKGEPIDLYIFSVAPSEAVELTVAKNSTANPSFSIVSTTLEFTETVAAVNADPLNIDVGW
jgi:hypothetical protein